MDTLELEDVYDLSQLPGEETEKFEFKSSRTEFHKLGDKLCRGVSAFANSGGGIFVAGVDASGNADGGLPSKKGKQPLRDWTDQEIHQITPVPAYDIKYGIPSDDRGQIDKDKKVLVVLVKESAIAPHMAPDHRYYIRAGVHTEPASHFIVEAIRSKRYLSKPRIAHIVRPSPDDCEVLQLGVVTGTASPAIDLEIAISHMPMTGKLLQEFPLRVELIDQQNPLFFDISTRESVRREPEQHEFTLKVTYHDLTSDVYEYERIVNIERSLSSFRFFHKGVDLTTIERSLESIAGAITGRSQRGFPQPPTPIPEPDHQHE